MRAGGVVDAMTTFLPVCPNTDIERVNCPCSSCAEFKREVLDRMYDEERDKHFDARRREDRRDVLKINGRCF